MVALDVAGLLRRIRRRADMSQRQLADACGVSQSVIARAEAGTRDPLVSLVDRAAAAAGARLAVLDQDGNELEPMNPAAVRDAGGRLFPAHLDTRHGDELWWGGDHRPHTRQPQYTFDRDRTSRDARRPGGAPSADHHVPEPGDSLADRAAARRQESLHRAQERRDRAHQAWVDAGSRSEPDWGTGCTCPPGCEYAEDSNEDLAHATDCPCGCDVA